MPAKRPPAATTNSRTSAGPDTNAPSDTLAVSEGSVSIRRKPSATTVVLVFGGLASGFGIPPFEFKRLVEDLDANVVFVRDTRQAWYQGGVEGLGSCLQSFFEELGDLIEREFPGQPISAVGNSAGGFAALQSQAYLPRVTSVVAFAPQTTVSRIGRLAMLDRRWAEQIASVRALRPAKAHLDARDAVAEAACSITVHYPTENRLDRRHAERLRSSHVDLVGHRSSSHQLVAEMKASGQLISVLRRAVDVAVSGA